MPSIGSRYHDQADDRISVTEPYGPSWYEVRRRAIGRPAEGLRVLVAEWHYPQLTEVYMEAELVALSRLGAHVEAWSDDEVAVRFSPSVPVHRGALADAVAAVRPHVVLSHWLHVGHRYREVTARAGVPHVVRGHGFDFDPAVVDDLLRDRGVVVHLFPHLAQQWSWHPRVTTHPVAIDGRRYPPNRDKDRTLVVRLAAGLITKDMDVFFEAAKRCPDHRFVLGLGHVYNAEGLTEELARRAVELDAPVEVLVDLDFEQAASLVGRAGTYVHTHGTDHPVGMPTSIAEAMATGAYVLARDLPGARAFLGRAGATYAGGSVEERADRVAALVNATTRWDDARWASTWTAAVDQAWTRFPAELVVAAMVEEWRALLGVGRR